jgi:hypothetical protein
MLKKKYKFLILIVTTSLIFSGCSTVKKAFDPQRKNSSEEFLVEKKSPLSMPPDFDELPVPQNNNEDIQDQSDDIELLITDNDKNKKLFIETESFDKDFEKFILDKIKNY